MLKLVRFEYVIFGSLLILAGWLRLYKLDTLMPFTAESGKILIDGVQLLENPNLPAVVSRFWYQFLTLVPLYLGKGDPYLVSILSVALGIATIGMVFIYLSRLKSRRAAIIATSLLATFPLVVVYNRMISPLTLVMFLSSILVWSLAYMTERPVSWALPSLIVVLLTLLEPALSGLVVLLIITKVNSSHKAQSIKTRNFPLSIIQGLSKQYSPRVTGADWPLVGILGGKHLAGPWLEIFQHQKTPKLVKTESSRHQGLVSLAWIVIGIVLGLSKLLNRDMVVASICVPLTVLIGIVIASLKVSIAKYVITGLATVVIFGNVVFLDTTGFLVGGDNSRLYFGPPLKDQLSLVLRLKKIDVPVNIANENRQDLASYFYLAQWLGLQISDSGMPVWIRSTSMKPHLGTWREFFGVIRLDIAMEY